MLSVLVKMHCLILNVEVLLEDNFMHGKVGEYRALEHEE